jgi:cell division GTPase FtsZ
LGDRSYEKILDEENQIIFKSFKSFYDLSKLEGSTAFDTEDYKGLFDEQGCLAFSETTVPYNEGDNSLAAAAVKSWRNTVYLSGDVTKATAMAVVVQRPTGFDKGGNEINDLFESIKEAVPSGKFCRGVYFADNLLDRAAGVIGNGKPIRISSMLAGLPFPLEFFNKLKEQVDIEMADVKDKKRREDPSFDLDPYIDFVDQGIRKEVIEELDFTIFKEK